MLGMKAYNKDYISRCRATIEENLRTYNAQVGKAGRDQFEVCFFNSQVLLLDYMFVHRLSGIEGKDGNPLNEVRVLCNSILFNDGKLQVEKLPGWPNSAVTGLKLPSERSILKLKSGDNIQIKQVDFVRLASAFFTEIEKRYL
ncbi:MAG: hypothetical protein ACREC0_03320 [Methylocella sp.]